MSAFFPRVDLVKALILMFSCSTFGQAASVLKLERASFDKVGRDEWLRARISLSTTGNPSPEAKDPRFLDSLKMRIHLSFREKKNGFSFYSSEVELVSLEQGERYWVDFFLPGEVVKRDRLNTKPFAYLLEFEVAGHSIPFDAGFASSNMNSEEARVAFGQKVNQSKTSTDGILLPSYLAPFYLWSEDETNYPAFRRSLPIL